MAEDKVMVRIMDPVTLYLA